MVGSCNTVHDCVDVEIFVMMDEQCDGDTVIAVAVIAGVARLGASANNSSVWLNLNVTKYWSL